MASVIVFAFASMSAATNHSPACTMLSIQNSRPPDAIELTPRATPDSVRDTHPPSLDAIRRDHRARLPWDTATVYAQVFDLVRADGDVSPLPSKRPARVALVWWRLGLQCQRVSPAPAVRAEIAELFLAGRRFENSMPEPAMVDAILADLRPPHEWIDAMPTFDVSDAAWVYSPQYRRPVNLPRSAREYMTVDEYRDFFEHLPLAGTSIAEREAGWRALLRWGDADPRRWTLYPAVLELCSAIFNVNDTTRSRERCERRQSRIAIG